MKLIFFGQRTDHGAAIAFLEEALKQASNSIFLIDGLAEAFLVLECFFKILFGGDRLLLFVHQLEGEVADHPHERGEILRVLLGVGIVSASAGFDLDILREVDNQA